MTTNNITNQIRNQNGEWVNGEPTENGQKYRKKIAVNNEKYGYEYLTYSIPVTAPVINIAIASVAPQLTGFDNKPNEYTVSEFTDITATGSGLAELVAMGLTKFRVPFVRTDTMRKAYMVATIEPDGTFNLNINFKSGGKWVVNTELLNSELTPEELALFSFSINEHVFKVI